MSEAKHTPGPWKLLTLPRRGCRAVYRIEQAKRRYDSPSAPDGSLRIAELYAHRFGSADRVPGDGPNDLANADTEGCQMANAALIAAAPDLLAACKLALDRFQTLEDAEEATDADIAARCAVQDAIRRAETGAP